MCLFVCLFESLETRKKGERRVNEPGTQSTIWHILKTPQHRFKRLQLLLARFWMAA